jgi:hypothetical protein
MRWAHWNCIEPASCWRPPRRPRTEACTRDDLRRRSSQRHDGSRNFGDQSRPWALHAPCAKELDWDDPVTEVLTLSTTSAATNDATGTRSCSAGSRIGGALPPATTGAQRSSSPPSRSPQSTCSGYETRTSPYPRRPQTWTPSSDSAPFPVRKA